MTARSTPRERLMAVLPGVAVLRRYQRSWLRSDVIAGATVGAMLIPQSMAYAELAGMPPQYGFYAVIGALVLYALVGTSRHLGVGPEPGTAILSATGVAAIAGDDPARYVALMAALAIVVAAICLLSALLRLGFLAALLSKPVLVGYITGVGLTLLSSQIASFTGVPITEDSFFPRVGDLLTHLDAIHWPTTVLSLCTLVFILVLRHRAPALPGVLLGVAAATALVAVFSWDDAGIVLVGAIPAGLPVPGLPDVSLDDLWRLVPVAAGVALVGYSDNVLTARSLAAGRGYRIDANQELVALGVINLSAGLSQGFPISSSASRTAVPASLGSKTQLVSIIGSGFVVVTLLVLRPLLGEIPRAALAAVIVSAAIAIIDVTGYRTLWRVSRVEFVLAVATALGVIVLGVLVGVLVAISLSIVVALYRVARPHDAVLGDQPGSIGWVDAEAYPDAVTEPGLLVYRFDAPLFFVNADHFRQRLEDALAANPGVEEWLVLDFEGIGALDATALDVLDEIVPAVTGMGVQVIAVARANHTVLARLERASLLEPTGALRVYPTINSAVRAFRQR